MYRILKLSVAVVALLGVATLVVAQSGSAMAATSSPAARSPQAGLAAKIGTYNFGLYNPAGDKNCIVTNGVGKQLTDSTSGCAKITITRTNVITSTGDFTYDFTDGNGKCVRANSSGVVKIESKGCNTHDDGELWVVTSCTEIMNACTTGFGSKYRFENGLQLSWMKTTGYVPGDKVRVGTGGANDWDLYVA